MNKKEARHIVTLIENTPFAGLTAEELSSIRVHTAECDNCRIVFEAAHVSKMMLKERAAETIEPTPFFQTRVLAAVRERQSANESWGLLKLWRSAGALASSMAATVAVLMVLTFVVPATQESNSTVNVYSAEGVIMNYDFDELNSDSQVLSTLYGAEEDMAK
jgi:anti-sigma-K factor RskA